MALEKTFRRLSEQLRKLNDALFALRLTVVEDKPLRGEVALVDDFENAVEDLVGWLEEARGAASEAERRVGHPVDLERTRRALTTCQERFHRIEQGFSTDLVAYERLKDLAGLGSERRGEWQGWASIVRKGIEQCRQPLESTSKALSDCWQEIAERVGTTVVSVQATSIGQKFDLGMSAEGKELHRKGVT